MDEIQQLRQEVESLKAIVSQFAYSDRYIFGRHIQLEDGKNFYINGLNGTKFGISTSSKIGFWNATPAVQPTNGVNLTNNVTVGGTTDTIANYTDLSTYGNDAAAIRNNIYQLARKLKVVNDSLRTIGLNS